MQEYLLQNRSIKLNLSPKVFTPSLTSLFLAQNLRIEPGETVFDVGCGAGILSILAAKLSAKRVIGSDINRFAVELSQKNAELNDIKIAHFFGGDLFGERNNWKYDVIVSNIPQTPIPPGLNEREWYLDGNGGIDGTDKINTLLLLAKGHLTGTGRMYIPVVWYSNPLKTINLVKSSYHWKKIAEFEFPLDFKLYLRIPYFLELKKEGKSEIYQKENNLWYCKEELYELRLKH